MHPVRALFDHDAWANDELLRRCAELPPEVLSRETPGTLGTIPRTMTHVAGTGQFLLALLTGQRSADAIPAGQRHDLVTLQPIAREVAARWRELLDSSPDPDAPIGPDMHETNRWVLMVQYIHHGDTHRAHVGSVMGAAGVEPPEVSGWAFGKRHPDVAGSLGTWADALLLRCFDHVGWAMREVLEHCLGLGERALGATAAGTYGTAHETLTHMIDSHAGYVVWMTGAEDVELKGAAEPDMLREFAERGRAGWRTCLDAGLDHERIVPTGGPRPAPAWLVTLQAIHHANDHLAHLGTILGANGLPVPDVDVCAYQTALATSG
jgi:uncharacterized damage-inducible protein DinB